MSCLDCFGVDEARSLIDADGVIVAELVLALRVMFWQLGINELGVVRCRCPVQLSVGEGEQRFIWWQSAIKR